MSLVFNMVGGGSGGGSGPSASDAILTVTVPTGSTVTATKGGVTLSPTMWVQAADATQDCALFVIAPSLFDSVNPWTVTATRGTDTASDTVIISENKQYDVELVYFPTGYTRLNYVETSGVQRAKLYFNSSKNLNALKYVADVNFTSASGSQTFFGYIGGTFLPWISSNKMYPVTDSNSFGTGTGRTDLFNNRHKYSWEVDNDQIVVKVDDSEWYRGNLWTNNADRIGIFYDGGWTGGNRYLVYCRLYSAQIYDIDQTTLLFDLAPAMRNSDSVVGLKDLNSSLFVTTDAGTFAYG